MQILFLNPIENYSKSTSITKHELQNAAARSHAAKVSRHRVNKGCETRTRLPNLIKKPVFPDIVDSISASRLYPGFGSFRSELHDLLPDEACAADSTILDFFVEVTLPGIDVANEVFDNSGPFHLLLANLVSLTP